MLNPKIPGKEGKNAKKRTFLEQRKKHKESTNKNKEIQKSRVVCKAFGLSLSCFCVTDTHQEVLFPKALSEVSDLGGEVGDEILAMPCLEWPRRILSAPKIAHRCSLAIFTADEGIAGNSAARITFTRFHRRKDRGSLAIFFAEEIAHLGASKSRAIFPGAVKIAAATAENRAILVHSGRIPSLTRTTS